MRALITGATGFIGRNLARELLSSSWTVTALVRASSDLRQLELEVGDLNRLDIITVTDDLAECLQVLQKIRPDTIFHLAAKGSADHQATQVDQLIEVNIRLGVHLLESLRSGNVSSPSGRSTSFVATGSFWQHYEGTSDFAPTSLYAATKQAFEDLMRFYRDVAGIPCVMLKLFDVYGPRDTRGRFLDLLCASAESGEALKLSPGDQLVDLVHVDDVSRAFMLAATTLADRPQDLKLAHTVPASDSLSVKDIVAQLSQILGRDIPINWGGRPYRQREVMRPWRGDPLPDWQAEIDLCAGIEGLMRDK